MGKWLLVELIGWAIVLLIVTGQWHRYGVMYGGPSCKRGLIIDWRMGIAWKSTEDRPNGSRVVMLREIVHFPWAHR